MKRLLYIFLALCLFVNIGNAALKLHWEMDSADDFNLGQDIFGYSGRTYVTNTVTGSKLSGMTAAANVRFDPSQGALRIDRGTSKIYGLVGNDKSDENVSLLFPSKTEYTFSLWAKGDLDAVQENGYSFYLKYSTGEVFKCDLGFKYNKSACFTAPGNAWAGNASGIWDPNNTAIYVNPEAWNMYTFTWDASSNHVASYVNGVMRGSWGDNDGNDIPAIAAGAVVSDFGFGDLYGGHSPGGWYRNYRIWDEALDATEVADLVGDFFLYAQDPTPASSSNFITDANTMALTLSWQAGTYVASHDLYIGTDFDDVNDADTLSAEYFGSIAINSQDVNLASGETYYWRVDEVNDIDIWKGAVWSFTIAAVPDPVLLWEMDSEDDFTVDGGRLHVDNKMTGNKLAGMTSTSGIGFDPGEGAIYMDGVHPCKIYGMVGNDDGEPNLFVNHPTQLTFSMFAKGDKAAVSGNGYSFYLFYGASPNRFKCDLSWKPAGSAGFTAPGSSWMNNAYDIWDPAKPAKYVNPETWNMYTFVWDTENNFIGTYVNGILRASIFGGVPITPSEVLTDFGFGDGYGYGGPGGWFKDFRIYDTALNKDEINFILGDSLLYPQKPSPANGATGVALDGTVLTWDHGLGAVSQDVYFGKNQNMVANAGTSSSTYQGQIALEDSFDPNISLEMMKTYYWRVDQLDTNGDLIIKGPVWQFNTVDSIMVEDFESYDTEGNSIGAVWIDKYGYVEMDVSLNNPTEGGPVLSPVNSMKLLYHVPYDPYYSVAACTFSSAQDWTAGGVKMLTIHYYGDATNMELPAFVTIGDGTNDANVFVDVNTLAESWGEINVSLPAIELLGVDLSNVTYMEIGFGDGTDQGMSFNQKNTIYVDDIVLYPPSCVPSESSLQADFTGDCTVDYYDLAYIADNWLSDGEGDINSDSIVDFVDYSILASEWLVEDFWP